MRTADVGTPSIAMRSYLSTHYLWAAEHFARLAGEIEHMHAGRPPFDIRHRAYVISAILAGVAFLEAAINELFQDFTERHGSLVGALDEIVLVAFATYWNECRRRGSILEKYQTALRLGQRTQFDKKAQPYKDAVLLVWLRNQLVHSHPETVAAGAEEVKRQSPRGIAEQAAKQLRGKFAPNRLMNGSKNPFYPDKCLGAGCALWATRTVRLFADDFHDRLGVTPNYHRARWGEDGGLLSGSI